MGKASRKLALKKLQRPAIVSSVAWEDAGVEARKCFIDLAARLGIDSSNSSMPQSRDGPDSSGSTGGEKSSKAKKKSGAQPGHPRHERPLRDFQAMIDVGGATGDVGRIAKSADQKLIQKWKELQRGKINRSTFEKHDQDLSTEVSVALMDGLTCEHAKTEGVCKMLFNYFDCLWTFTKVDGVEPTNFFAKC